MTSIVPNAYQLALALKPALELRMQATVENLSKDGFKHKMDSFTSCIKRDGRVGFNTSIETVNQILESGEWLNRYEITYKKTKKTGDELLREIHNQIPEWFDRRQKIEVLLNFGQDAHYAALYLGGRGAQRYGDCCVIVDVTTWGQHFTCFGGDTIRACFDGKGHQLLDDDEIRALFGIGQDVEKIACIKHEYYIRDGRPGVVLSELRAILESSDALIEIHLHGSVARDHIRSVILPEDKYHELVALSLRYKAVSKPAPQEFDVVPHFEKMVSLTALHGISLEYV